MGRDSITPIAVGEVDAVSGNGIGSDVSNEANTGQESEKSLSVHFDGLVWWWSCKCRDKRYESADEMMKRLTEGE